MKLKCWIKIGTFVGVENNEEKNEKSHERKKDILKWRKRKEFHVRYLCKKKIENEEN